MKENKNFDETKLIHTEEVRQEMVNEPSNNQEMAPQSNNYNNMALGYGRNPNYSKNKLNNQDNELDDKLAKNKNNQDNRSNEAAKNLATGGNGNKSNKEDNDENKDKKDKDNKENKDKNGDKKEQNSNNKNKTTQKRSNSLSNKKESLKERLNPLNRLKSRKKEAEQEGESEVAQAAKKGIKALIMAIPLPIRLMILAGIIVFLFIIFFIVILVTLLSGNNTAFGSDYGYINGICKDGVTVTDESGNITGTYPLEEYVAGVIAKENVYENNGNIEAMKAQAIASRTFALYHTNFCEKTIENSQSAQTMTNPTELTTRAAQETAGMVLKYKGEIFSAQYDSYVRNGSCNNSGCTATYTKVPSNKTHTVKLSPKFAGQIAGGHGRGMSQLAARDLQDKGYDYERILKYFYADGVEIAKLLEADGEGLVLDEKTGFMMRLARPQRTNAFYYKQDEANLGKYCEGECAWYGTARAAEILSSIGSTKTWNANPNGGSFCYAADAKNFKTSRNYRKPKQGAIVSWTQGGNYGHVAIVEKVEGNSVTISEAYLGLGYNVGSGKWSKEYVRSRGCQSETAKTNCESGTGTGCFQIATLTLSEMSNYYGSYNFACYIYLVED